jgi:hypothetical protein
VIPKKQWNWQSRQLDKGCKYPLWRSEAGQFLVGKDATDDLTVKMEIEFNCELTTFTVEVREAERWK